MRILYIDAFSGVSGDKMVASLLSLCGKFAYLKEQLSTLKIDDEFKIEFTDKNVQGIESGYFKVIISSEEDHTNEHSSHEHGSHEHGIHEDHNHDEHSYNLPHDTKPHSGHHIHRNLHDIENIIERSSITENAKKISKGIFSLIALAEAKVHGKSIEEVHFHEVGAVDSIIDIVSTGILIDALSVEEIYSSNIPTGNGFIVCQHGTFPVPAPATVEILKGIPVEKTDITGELTTPTGAAIVKYLAKEFGAHPPMIVENIGYGAGTRELPIPNVLRLEVGTKTETKKIITDFDNDVVAQLETNIDDATPENLAYLSQILFDKNALDVFTIPVVMKKGRLASLLTVICHEKDRQEIENVIFLNSTTFGIRRSYLERTVLKREIRKIVIEGIDVGIKYGYLGEKLVQKSIEFDDAKNLSLKLKLSYKETIELINKRI